MDKVDIEKLVGRTYPSSAPYEVSRRKLLEFALATRAKNPLYLDVRAARMAGYMDLLACPTFPIVLQEPVLRAVLADEQVDLDFSRVVHGEQEFSYTQPILAGDVLKASGRIVVSRILGRNRQLGVEVQVRDEMDGPVVNFVSLLIARN